jgi:hypothetical protein
MAMAMAMERLAMHTAALYNLLQTLSTCIACARRSSTPWNDSTAVASWRTHAVQQPPLMLRPSGL